jgi:RNA polymerase primary sigma factor
MKNIDYKLIQDFKDNLDSISLCERDRMVLAYRYGLYDNTLHTLEETAKIFNLTRERIRQIENLGISKLRLFVEGDN